MFETWAENLYDETFSDVFDALVAEYKNGEISEMVFLHFCCIAGTMSVL